MDNEVVGKLRARVAAWQHGNPSRSLKLIAVAGAKGKTTTILLLSEILQEAGKGVMTMTNHGCFHNGEPIGGEYDASAKNVQRVLSIARKKNVDYVIMEISDQLVATATLPTLMIEMSIITNDSQSARALLEQAVEYTVVPGGFDVAGLSVAPHQAISFGYDELSEAQIAQVRELRKGTEIEIVIDHQTKLQAATYLIGKTNALNVAAAVSAAYVLAADTSAFEEGIARLERVAANYDYIPIRNAQYDIVVDAATEEPSIGLVLQTAAHLKHRRLLVAVDDTISPDLYDSIKRLSDRVAVVGNAPDVLGVEKAEGAKAAFELLKRAAKKDDTVLLLGAQYGARDSDNVTYAHTMVNDASE